MGRERRGREGREGNGPEHAPIGIFESRRLCTTSTSCFTKTNPLNFVIVKPVFTRKYVIQTAFNSIGLSIIICTGTC